MRHTILGSPIGELTIYAADDELVAIRFDGAPSHPSPTADAATDHVLAAAVEQLEAFFAGRLTAFDLPLAPRGTAFQLDVWKALADIPYGTTTSYAAVASTVGRPTAVRAVGAANGANPLPIVLPCHRVVGSNKTLTGYAGGLDRKRWLLDLESGRSALPN